MILANQSQTFHETITVKDAKDPDIDPYTMLIWLVIFYHWKAILIIT